MKKLLVFSLAAGLFVACNSGTKEEKGTTKSGAAKNADYEKGLELVAKNKCMTCHSVDDAITGPPYREVANKYASYPDTIVSHLADKIISGGNGVWGEVFMTPHPDVSKEDAETMVKYILQLKK